MLRQQQQVIVIVGAPSFMRIKKEMELVSGGVLIFCDGDGGTDAEVKRDVGFFGYWIAVEACKLKCARFMVVYWTSKHLWKHTANCGHVGNNLVALITSLAIGVRLDSDSLYLKAVVGHTRYVDAALTKHIDVV